METLLWIIFITVISKALLKAIRPDLNDKINQGLKSIVKALKAYYDYCKQWW
jgi:hypothetical protein|tara:strand:+ start:1160 stop:1315 length:156 start_codon:yes stop_codon:yes gene_type:complete